MTAYGQPPAHPGKGPRPRPNEERFWAKVSVGPGCWEFNGARAYYNHPNGTAYGGYGIFGVRTPGIRGHRLTLTHRYAWTLAHGAIPKGMRVLHHCDNPSCVKTEPDEQWPDGHLFLGTAKENSEDMTRKGRARGQANSIQVRARS